MSKKRVQVKMGGRGCEVPIIESEAMTREIAAHVDERLQSIEAAAARIDTVAFALEAAFSFAAETARLRNELDAIQERHATERNEESQALMAALEQVTTRLERIVQRANDSAT